VRAGATPRGVRQRNGSGLGEVGMPDAMAVAGALSFDLPPENSTRDNLRSSAVQGHGSCPSWGGSRALHELTGSSVEQAAGSKLVLK